MKLKKFIYILIIYFLAIGQSFATQLTITPIGTPTGFSNKISQSINLAIDADSNWRMEVYILSPEIINQNNFAYSLPINRLEITKANGTPIILFNSGIKVAKINSNDIGGVNNFNLSLNTTTFENDRPGYYSTEICFVLIDKGHKMDLEVYNLRFQKEEISSIEFSENPTRLELDKEKILKKGVTQNISTPLTVSIKSNKNWKLYLQKTNINPASKVTYYIKPLYADASITLNNSSSYTKMDNNTYLIASGKATFNDNSNTLDKKFLTMSYMIKGPENELLPVGSESNLFQYSLKTED
ncbi:MAG: hypothetical protein LKG27_00520 [Clostridiaceae bacterium]|jgi:hypothetical protein|nr:hypothetical protein [Clostridiaceae bacterium]